MTKQYSLNMWVRAAQTLYVWCRSVTRALRNNLKTQNKTTAKENVDVTSYILLCLNHNFRSFVDLIFNLFRTVKEEVSYIKTTERFHMTSRRPYWGTKKFKRWYVGLKSFLL